MVRHWHTQPPAPLSHGCPSRAENMVCPDKLRHGRSLGRQSPSKHSRPVRRVSCVPGLGATACLKVLTQQRPTLGLPGAELLTRVRGPPHSGRGWGDTSSPLTPSAKQRGCLRGESPQHSAHSRRGQGQGKANTGAPQGQGGGGEQGSRPPPAGLSRASSQPLVSRQSAEAPSPQPANGGSNKSWLGHWRIK